LCGLTGQKTHQGGPGLGGSKIGFQVLIKHQSTTIGFMCFYK